MRLTSSLSLAIALLLCVLHVGEVSTSPIAMPLTRRIPRTLFAPSTSLLGRRKWNVGSDSSNSSSHVIGALTRRTEARASDSSLAGLIASPPPMMALERRQDDESAATDSASSDSSGSGYCPDPPYDDGFYHPGKLCACCKPFATYDDGFYHPGFRTSAQAAAAGLDVPDADGFTPDPPFDDGLYHPGRKCATCRPYNWVPATPPDDPPADSGSESG
ncbi:hypothetical protein K437DRAFT_80329 [Tilletiaria anomala UBC 951]|uniref:Secreted protein n=1 Tax=Tilletiaria anomala (strain ATCC 24038 / CBS 436.72 / UBC 951) TaxID=1037660 RepID=A0A066V9E3_TILAU|nr:uncharacterized protein K437DRAFT_80329 [Tilletiaria anomala UBC 951]KDN35349.1 hypothetical protein K437DRAFT_80329 [Tilletiaria anomala UBC 951]